MEMEMDFWGKSARCSILEKIRNNFIREKNNLKNSVLDYIRYKKLNWNVDMRIMDEERLPQKMLEWCPSERSRKIPQNSRMHKVTTRMREKRINNMEWIDKEEWSKKIKL